MMNGRTKYAVVNAFDQNNSCSIALTTDSKTAAERKIKALKSSPFPYFIATKHEPSTGEEIGWIKGQKSEYGDIVRNRHFVSPVH